MDAVAGTSFAPCLPPGGLFEIVFSFDTTGSMSRVIDEVKGRLQDMIQRLQADIPGIRFGVIAHGDYCDKDVFYLEQHIELTTNIVALTDFVKDIEGTGGGDPEECYEYILWLARGYNWTEGSRRALVVIGDSVPHEADYELNTQRLDWREQSAELAKKGVKIYSVQAFDDDSATAFFEEMATVTQGQHLKLGEFSNICDFIMAICYRERGDEFLEGYEAEVRAREARKGLHKDLEGLFGVLRRGDSSASNTGSLVKAPSSTSDMNPVGPMAPLLSRLSSASSSIVSTVSSSSPKMAIVKPVQNPKPTLKTKTVRIYKNKDLSKGAKRTQNPKVKEQKNTRKLNVKTVVNAKYRHLVPDSEFILKKRNLATRWSNWKLAITPEDHGSRKHWVERKDKSGFRRKCLFPKDVFSGRALFEIAVQRSKGCKLYVMQAKWSLTRPSEENWEQKLIRNNTEKNCVQAVLKNGGKVFIRRFIPKGLGKVQRDLLKSYKKDNLYQYAWSAGLTKPGRLSWTVC